jgi:predicted phage terminase large subunit-like protein
MSAAPSLLTPNRLQYPSLLNCLAEYPIAKQRPLLRSLCQTDLYFLLRYACKREDIENDWYFNRCREVQALPDGRIDLWAREHGKSSIITFGLTVQDILNNPEVTVGIFSHTRPIAKGFLRQIKRELESNETLKSWFPDILYANPQADSPKWSEDEGIIVRRKTNPKEATVEAWGLVDSQPTSKHYSLMVYDDVVTRESVTTPDQIAKVTEAWELSTNLTSEGGAMRMVGTRYHFNDTYSEIMRRKAAVPRIHPATDDGTMEGNPVLLSKETLERKRREQGQYTFACQQLLNPVADDAQGFKQDWMGNYDQKGDGKEFNRYILVDPANDKKKSSDYTAMFVIGLGADENYYILDILRDRLNLTERTDALFSLHRRWKPKRVGYERYGMMADIDHIKDKQAQTNYRFEIIELGGKLSKNDRIRRLIPLFEMGRIYFPESCYRTNYEGKMVELVQTFLEEEFKAFPVGLHDDMLDALSRILDDEMIVEWPKLVEEVDRYRRKYTSKRERSWMGV